jgi:putative flippase GtrA
VFMWARSLVMGLWRRHGDRLWRYLLVGLAGVVVNFAVLKAVWPLLHHTPSAADAVASEVAILANYFMNTRFTFRTRPTWRTLLQFNLVLACGSLIQVGVFTLLVDLGVYYLLANLLAIPFNTVIGFVLSQVWVFRPTPSIGSPEMVTALGSVPTSRASDDDSRPAVGSADRRG